jgi:hypothetical protein
LRLQAFLKKKGIIVGNLSLGDLAEAVCSVFLGIKDIEEIVSYSSIRANKIKTTPIQFASGSRIDEIGLVLKNISDLLPSDYLKLKINYDALNVEIDAVSKEISLDLPFTRIDYSRTALLQEESHNLTCKIRETAEGSYDVFYTVPCSEAQQIVSSLNTILKGSKEDNYIHEILLSELDNSCNDFFDKLLDDNGTGYDFESATTVKMQLRGTTEEDMDEDNDEVESENDDSSGNPIIKTLSVSGTNILQLEVVKEWIKKGYFIKSVSANFLRKASSQATDMISLTIEFNTVGRFQSEVKKVWQVIREDGVPEKNKRTSISTIEREAILKALNNKAFSIFDNIRQQREADKKNKVGKVE